jgi:hypothetical protein
MCPNRLVDFRLISLLSSLFKTFGIVFVARDTRALVYSFPMYHFGFRSEPSCWVDVAVVEGQSGV